MILRFSILLWPKVVCISNNLLHKQGKKLLTCLEHPANMTLMKQPTNVVTRRETADLMTRRSLLSNTEVMS